MTELPLTARELDLWWVAYNAQVEVNLKRVHGGGLMADTPQFQARKAVLMFRGRADDVLPRLHGPTQEHQLPGLYDYHYARTATKAMLEHARNHA